MKKFLQENEWKTFLCFVAMGVFFIAIIFCAKVQGNNIYKNVATNSSLVVAEGVEKCRQCGRAINHKGYFCSENCRESYADEYHAERYGKAICRNCGEEFIKPTAYSYCCSPKCGYEYSEDIKMVGEAEEYRKSKQSNDANREG